MALHEKVSTMAVEAIDEYLAASLVCLGYRKPENGCLGYPATLMLFCVVNALGTYLIGDTVVIDGVTTTITRGEPFRVFNHDCFGLGLGGRAIKLLEHSYRNALAHNAVIEEGTSILPSDQEPPFVLETI